MEQYLSSIKKFFYDLWPVRIYHERLPDEIETPSIYYYLPDQTDQIYSKLSFETLNILRVSVFESTDEAAYNQSYNLAEAVRKAKYRIPLLNSDGTIIPNTFIDIESISCSLTDNLEARLTITFSLVEKFN
jgi:hypothetical protein